MLLCTLNLTPNLNNKVRIEIYLQFWVGHGVVNLIFTHLSSFATRGRMRFCTCRSVIIFSVPMTSFFLCGARKLAARLRS